MPPRAAPDTRRDRPSQTLNPYLREVLRGFRATFVAVFSFSFFINLLTLVVPLYLLQIYAKVLPSGNIDTLIFLTAMAIAAIIALGLLEAIRRALLSKAGARFERRVSEHLLDSAIRRAIVKSRTSINALRDLATVRGFVSGSGMLPLLDLPWSPLFILVLYVLHPVLGVIGTVGACLLFALAVLNERLTREPLGESARESRDMLEDARAYVRNADVIEAMGLHGELFSRWNARGADATVTSYRANRLNTRLASLSKLLRLFLQIAVIGAAAYLITRGELTAGATIASVLLLRRAVSPLEQSIRSWKSVLGAREAIGTISEYLDHAATLEPDSTMPTPSGALVASRVGFRPSGAARSVFSRVDLEVPPGALTALVGPTAAGKSTLLRVLAGVVPPSGGRVTLGGYDFAHWHAAQRGQHVGYLPQDVSLFPVTVRENIARLADAPIEAVVAAAERANAHEMIQTLPEGYDTLVEEGGANLSGGQRQRIGFARALFGEPKVVLLDEPDANLDADGRSVLRKSLRKLRREGVALLAITHHASLEKTADRVYRLEDGKVRLERDGRIVEADDAEERAAEPAGESTGEAATSSVGNDATSSRRAERPAPLGPLVLAPVPSVIAEALRSGAFAEREAERPFVERIEMSGGGTGGGAAAGEVVALGSPSCRDERNDPRRSASASVALLPGCQRAADSGSGRDEPPEVEPAAAPGSSSSVEIPSSVELDGEAEVSGSSRSSPEHDALRRRMARKRRRLRDAGSPS